MAADNPRKIFVNLPGWSENRDKTSFRLRALLRISEFERGRIYHPAANAIESAGA